MINTPPFNTPVVPRQRWLNRERIIRGILFLAALAALLGLLTVGDVGDLAEDLSLGQRAPRAEISTIDFDFNDSMATANERDRAAAADPPVWQVNLDGVNTSWGRITKLVERLAAGHKDAVERWNESSPRSQLSLEEAAAFAHFAADHDRLTKAERLLRSTASEGIIADRAEVESMLTAENSDVIIKSTEERRVLAQSLQTPSEAVRAFEKQLLAKIPEAESARTAWRQLANDVLQPNLRFNRDESLRRQEARRRTVPAIRHHVTRGEVLVYMGQEVTPQILERLRAHKEGRKLLRPKEMQETEFYGQSLLILVVLLACCGYLWSNHPQILENNRHLSLMLMLALMNLIIVKAMMIFSDYTFLTTFSIAQFAIPMALAPLLTGALLQPSLGVFMALFISVFTAIITGNSFTLLITSLVSGLVGVYFTKQMRRRSRLVFAGLGIAAAQMLCICALAGMTHVSPPIMASQALAGVINGLLTVFLASGMLPIFEYFFHITTDVRLLELSDLNHPLLKKLCLAAPGTYHHSLMVANLAESAAQAINANPLLARVCSYYHDVGKVAQPDYYTENQGGGINPHDQLAPAESFQIIASHVRAGEELAHKYRLSPPIIDVIRQHHGTTVAYSFFHKAKRWAQEAAAVVRPFNADATPIAPPAEEEYRYGGPKPQFREAAIISLADAIESASRSLTNTAPETVRILVNDIINRRFQDGQLDECNLTIHELRIIANRFTQTLLNVLHTRVAYPKDEKPAPTPAVSTEPEQPPAPPADQQNKIA